jgi:hypothetical protein
MQDSLGLMKSARALEESFFARENEKRLKKMRAEARREEKRKQLREVLKIDDEQVLDRLVELEVGPETAMAFSVVPLVEVAWADGEISSKERRAVLRAAEERGIVPGTTPCQLLEDWLEHRPEAELMETWKGFMRSLMDSLDPDIADAVKERIINRTRAVAEAAGGFLGMGSISPTEQAVLDEMEHALG